MNKEEEEKIEQEAFALLKKIDTTLDAIVAVQTRIADAFERIATSQERRAAAAEHLNEQSFHAVR